jgi:transcriptional regulator with XRE-family HTH domain
MNQLEILRLLTESGRTQRDLARHLGVDPSIVNKIIKGTRQIKADEADQIRSFFKSILPRNPVEINKESSFLHGRSGNVTIPEVDMRAGGASGGDLRVWTADNADPDNIEQLWSVPSSWVNTIPSPLGRDLYIFPVVGNSMAPDFPAGSRVLVNGADRQPSPPGPFVVFDGLSFVIKLVSYEPFSDPAMVSLASRDQAFPTYTRTADEAHIQGRVVGHWVWT